MRVDANGNIRLPMLKDPIQVRGMVPSQVESTIARSLTKGKVLVDPIVTVTIVEYQSRPVNVVGSGEKSVGVSGYAAHPATGCDRARGRDERRRRLGYCRQPRGRAERKTGQDHANHTRCEN